MKKYAIALSGFLLAFSLYSQEVSSEQVPVAVRKSFSMQFPSAKSVQYGIESSDYIVLFSDQGSQCIVTYNKSGKLIETQREIAVNKLPAVISASAAKNFPGYTIMDAVKREAADKGVCYETDLKKGDAGYAVRFSESGEILQKEPRKVDYKVSTKTKR